MLSTMEVQWDIFSVAGKYIFSGAYARNVEYHGHIVHCNEFIGGRYIDIDFSHLYMK